MLVTKKIFLTKGVGVSREKLTSFELALRDAGIARFNLVRVSSIFPPGCAIVTREKGLSALFDGQIVYCVLAEAATNEPYRLAAASIGVAIPRDKRSHGYLSEHHAFGINADRCGDYAEDLAASMLATTLGINVDEELNYDKKKELWNLSGKIVRTTNMTQTAIGNRKGLWTTVVACAMFAG